MVRAKALRYQIAEAIYTWRGSASSLNYKGNFFFDDFKVKDEEVKN